MYFPLVAQFAHTLENVEVWLDKAEQHAAAKRFDVAVLMNARLAPDMGNFVYQVQSACDYVKGAAGWLSGRPPPRHEDNERTLDEVRARIRKTLEFVRSLPADAYAHADAQKVVVSWSPSGKVVGGQDYALQVAIPNIYFHVMAAYAILRHNGVEVGKMDFVGSVSWVDA